MAGVPFFVCLSYVFLAYGGYAPALVITSPIRAWRWNLVTLETRSIRRSFAALFLGSILQVFLDIIIDPVALQGSRWFLGQIYGYKEAGIHFGVPLSNYLGWWLVGFIMILALQVIDRTVGRHEERPAGVRSLPFRAVLGPLLYLSVIIFNLTMTLLIGERLMAVTGIFIYTLPLSMVLVLAIRRTNCYSKEELAEHLRNFPESVAGGRKG